MGYGIPKVSLSFNGIHKEYYVAICPRFTGIGLCAGLGLIEEGLRTALGPTYTTVCSVEQESRLQALAVARMEDKIVDFHPLWDDITTFDGRPWRGKVDIISGGLPCQPFSAAGQRRGLTDERWIWSDAARIIGEVDPDFVFLENSPYIRSQGLPVIVSDLDSLGFDAEWGVLSAADVGASQIRKRFWLLAHSRRGGIRRLQHKPWTRRPEADFGSGGTNVAALLADADSGRWQAEGRHPLPLFPPLPDDWAGWIRYLEAGGHQPGLLVEPDGYDSRLDEVHAIGNGVVPAVAATAFACLAERALSRQVT